MKKLFGFASLACTLMFVACDGISGTSANSNYSDSIGLSSAAGVTTSSSSSTKATISGSSKKTSNNYDPVTGILTDERDGEKYKTAKIGSQIWMAENLNYAYNEPTYSLDSSSFCYNNDADSCAKYGRLYLWSAAMDSAAVFSTNGEGCGTGKTCSPIGTVRGVCPKGWHLPSVDEWNALFSSDEIGGVNDAPKRVSTIGLYNSSFGRSIFPAGGYYGEEDCNGDNYYGEECFHDVGGYAYFWSSTEYGNDAAYYINFPYPSEQVYVDPEGKPEGLSVRCLRDED